MVIRVFEIGIWDKLAVAARITLAQEVFDQAQHYYDTDTMAKKRIDLQSYKDRGLIDVVECDAAEAAQVRARCCKFAELHPGELESLTILCRPEQDAIFCTADGGAIRAAVMLDLCEKLVSLEELLRRANLQRNFTDKDDLQFSERAFKRAVKRASIDKVQGFGTGGQG